MKGKHEKSTAPVKVGGGQMVEVNHSIFEYSDVETVIPEVVPNMISEKVEIEIVRYDYRPINYGLGFLLVTVTIYYLWTIILGIIVMAGGSILFSVLIKWLINLVENQNNYTRKNYRKELNKKSDGHTFNQSGTIHNHFY